MEKFIITGGAPLSGEVSVRGAKNAALPILISAAAGTQPVHLENVPLLLNDVQVTLEAIKHIGCSVDSDEQKGCVVVTPSDFTCTEPSVTMKLRQQLALN